MLYSSIRGSWNTHTHTLTFIHTHTHTHTHTRHESSVRSVAHLSEVELQRVVGGQRHHQAAGQILGQRVAMVTQKQTVVAERRHGDAHLSQIVQILQDRSLRHTHRYTITDHLTTHSSSSVCLLLGLSVDYINQTHTVQP